MSHCTFSSSCCFCKVGNNEPTHSPEACSNFCLTPSTQQLPRKPRFPTMNFHGNARSKWQHAELLSGESDHISFPYSPKCLWVAPSDVLIITPSQRSPWAWSLHHSSFRAPSLEKPRQCRLQAHSSLQQLSAPRRVRQGCASYKPYNQDLLDSGPRGEMHN